MNDFAKSAQDDPEISREGRDRRSLRAEWTIGVRETDGKKIRTVAVLSVHHYGRSDSLNYPEYCFIASLSREEVETTDTCVIRHARFSYRDDPGWPTQMKIAQTPAKRFSEKALYDAFNEARTYLGQWTALPDVAKFFTLEVNA